MNIRDVASTVQVFNSRIACGMKLSLSLVDLAAVAPARRQQTEQFVAGVMGWWGSFIIRRDFFLSLSDVDTEEPEAADSLHRSPISRVHTGVLFTVLFAFSSVSISI